MTQNNDHDFQQFRGAFNDAMIPDAEFKAKMEKMLQRETPISTDRASTVLASPPNGNSATVVPARRSSPLMVAAAVLTVFAVVVASVWVLSGEVLEGQYASAPSGIATMPADVAGTPGPDVHLSAERFIDWEQGDQLLGIYDHILIKGNYGDDDAGVLAAFDVRSGELLWHHSYQEFTGFDPGDFDSSTGILVGFSFRWNVDAPYGLTGRWLTAIDITTGETLWSHEIEYDQDFERHGSTTSPTIADGTVAIVYNTGEVRAWEITTGEFQWESTVLIGSGWVNRYVNPDGTEDDVIVQTLDTTAWSDHLVVVNGDGLITTVDPSTGDIIAEINAESRAASTVSPHSLQIDSYDEGVVLVRNLYSSDGLYVEIAALNPSTGDQFWQREFRDQLQTSSTDDGAIAVNTHIWKSNNWFMQLIGNHGYSTFQFHWIDVVTGEEILSTERGALEAPAVTLTDGTYGCTRTERNEIICFDRVGTRHIVEIDVLGDTSLVEGVLYIPTTDGLFRVELP